MPNAIPSPTTSLPIVDVESTAKFILSVQKASGEIPWSIGGKTDVWDHVESAMGLTVGGYFEQARKAYLWSAESQLEDGSWWSYYNDGKADNEAYKDSNMTAYIAVGVLHYYKSTRDLRFLQTMWPTVRNAMRFVLSLQGADGEVYWAKKADGNIDKKALLTGSSSIYLSICSAQKIAAVINEELPALEEAKNKLKDAINNKPHLFDQIKSRFSMDWYYPILCGAIEGTEAKKRIKNSWNKFAVPGWGIRCVSDAPWATMAETSEFVLSLMAMGDKKNAEMVFGWIREKQYEDGAFWTGVTFPEREIYTTEKTAWTSAAVLLAADSLYNLTPASNFFSDATDLTI